MCECLTHHLRWLTFRNVGRVFIFYKLTSVSKNFEDVVSSVIVRVL